MTQNNLKELENKFRKIFTDENWEKLEKQVKGLEIEFYKHIELDDDAWDFIINE